MRPVQLSPSTFLFAASSEADTTLSDTIPQSARKLEPRAVVLATWAFAHDNHIAKYVDRYRQMFPSATILVAKCLLRHFFWLPAARDDLRALAAAIRSLVVDGGHDPGVAHVSAHQQPSLVLHVFSNSGLSTAYQLREEYEKGLSVQEPFPQHVSIFDSTPGRYEYWSVASALQFGIPPDRWLHRALSVPLAHMLSSSLWVWCRVLKGEDWVTKWARAANDTSVRENCRSYAYSRADPLVESWVVESHAREARARGFSVVHTADFGNESAHVSHARTDPGRYWSLVMDTWKAAAVTA